MRDHFGLYTRTLIILNGRTRSVLINFLQVIEPLDNNYPAIIYECFASDFLMSRKFLLFHNE